MFGSLVDVTDSTVSQFSVDCLGQPVVDIIPTNDFPDESDPVDDDRRVLEEMPEKASQSNFRGQKVSSEAPGKASLQGLVNWGIISEATLTFWCYGQRMLSAVTVDWPEDVYVLDKPRVICKQESISLSQTQTLRTT
jgi:hypothetical protein